MPDSSLSPGIAQLAFRAPRQALGQARSIRRSGGGAFPSAPWAQATGLLQGNPRAGVDIPELHMSPGWALAGEKSVLPFPPLSHGENNICPGLWWGCGVTVGSPRPQVDGE